MTNLPKIRYILEVYRKVPLQNGSGTLETKKGITAANPPYAQEELFSSFLYMHCTIHAKAVQIFAEQKSSHLFGCFCILQIKIIIFCVSGVCIQLSSFRHSQRCGNHISEAYISIWIYRLFCFFFYIVLYARRFREKIS